MGKNEEKNFCAAWVQWFVGIFFTLAIAVFGYLIHRLDDQADHISKIEKNIAILTTFLNLKIPNTNLHELVTLSVKKKIPLEKIVTVLPMLKNNPEDAKTYLRDKLDFNSEEIRTVFGQQSHISNPGVNKKLNY